MTQFKNVLFGLACVFSLQISFGQTASADFKTVTEVAIYRIDPTKNEKLPAIMPEFRKNVSQLEGYKDYVSLQDLEHSNIYVDILHWDNIELALAASEAVKAGGEKYEPFTSTIDSLIFYSEFYDFKSFIHKKTKNMKNKVTEVVIYKIKADKVKDYSATIAEVSTDFLKTQKGFNSREILQDYQDNTLFLDIVIWDSLEDAQKAMQVSQKEASLIPFIEATEEIVTFRHYKPFK